MKIFGKVAVDKSPIHGKGVFAVEAISKGELIGEYTGKKVKKDGIHVLWIWEGEELLYGIDGTAPFKFLNHSSKPNAKFEDQFLYAKKNIKVGEEICFHYGEEWDEVP